MYGIKSIRLNNGFEIPAIGFGTWKISDGDEVVDAVGAALSAGYRLIDTAKLYGNETGVGQAIRQSKIPREEIFVTTKLWNDDQGYQSTLKAFDESLTKLGLDYLDLYLIHWPSSELRRDSWKALEEIYKSGRVKSIGVSNYMVSHLTELLDQSDTAPAVNQIEFNPFIYARQKPILDFCISHNILVEAYSPLSRGHNIDHPTISEAADRVGKTNAQVILRWAIQHKTVPIPKSVNPTRIKQNLEVFDFELSSNDMTLLDSLSE